MKQSLDRVMIFDCPRSGNISPISIPPMFNQHSVICAVCARIFDNIVTVKYCFIKSGTNRRNRKLCHYSFLRLM